MIRRKICFSHNSDMPFSQKEIVFVSYRHIDDNDCKAVLEQIRNIRQVAVWVDDLLSVGEYYDDEIEEAMLLSDIMVQVVTEHYFSEGSYTMDRELPLAKKAGLKVIAILCSNVSEEITSYLKESADYVCMLQDSDSIALVFEKIHEELLHLDFPQNFLRLSKRIDTWYLTPEDMFQLAYGFWRLCESDETHLIPPQFTEDIAKRYARAAAIAEIASADTLLEKLGIKQ